MGSRHLLPVYGPHEFLSSTAPLAKAGHFPTSLPQPEFPHSTSTSQAALAKAALAHMMPTPASTQPSFKWEALQDVSILIAVI